MTSPITNQEPIKKEPSKIEEPKPKKKDLHGIRQWSDKKSRLKCRQFESIDVARDTDHTYPSILWRTTCVKSKAPIAQLITKLIEGEQHLYQIQKS